MRTTLSLDPDVAARLQAEVVRTDRPLKQIVNEALRRGLHHPGVPRRPASRYRARTFAAALQPHVDPHKLNQLVDELETAAAAAVRR